MIFNLSRIKKGVLTALKKAFAGYPLLYAFLSTHKEKKSQAKRKGWPGKEEWLLFFRHLLTDKKERNAMGQRSLVLLRWFLGCNWYIATQECLYYISLSRTKQIINGTLTFFRKVRHIRKILFHLLAPRVLTSKANKCLVSPNSW